MEVNVTELFCDLDANFRVVMNYFGFKIENFL